MSFMPMNQDEYGQPVLQDISRQRKLADQLRAQSEEPLNGQMVSGVYIAPSWSQYLAKGLKSYMAGDTERNANKKEADYIKTKAQKIADFLKGNQAQTTQQGTTDTSVMPAFTPEQQDRFGSPLQGVQRQPVVTSTPNMVTESPDQVQARQRTTAYQLASEYGNDPSVQLALQDLNHQRDRGEQVGDRKDQWAHEDVNHVRDIGDQRQNMAIQNQYSVDNQGRVFAHDDASQLAGFNHADKSQQAGFAHDNTINAGNHAFELSQNKLKLQAANPLGIGQVSPITGGGNANSSVKPSNHFPTNSNIEYFNSLPDNVKSMVNALVEGRMPATGRNGIDKNVMTQLIATANAIDPNFDAGVFNARNKTGQDFSASGVTGKKLGSISTAIEHMANFEKDYKKLDNNNIGGEYINKSGNFIKSLYDPKIQNALGKTQTDINGIAGELANSFRSSGMSEKDIDEWRKTFSTNSTPETTKGSLESTIQLLNGKFQPQIDSYNRTMGTNKTISDFMSPEAKKVYDRINTGGALGSEKSVLAHPQDNEAVTWAKSNPNDPRSKAILQANGVK